MHDTPTQSSNRLDAIIAEYLAAEESGSAPLPEDVVAAHPEMAAELRQFFANRERVAVALPNEPPRKRFVPPRVRYFGDYELIDEIARGGMGVVYKAKQTSLNRIVAIKMILSGHLAREEDVRRFRTEAEAAANLKHAGIVPVHEVGVHEGHHYFSMDYIEGRSLAALVRENPLPARRAAEFVRSIGDAVHYAHQQGTLHRDLKPSNILIDDEDHVHVTDFGLAVRVEGDSELTRTGDILGTPAYMPPEQAQAKRGLIGPGSDVYSMGAILYELLTGRPPFRGESAVETLKLVIEAEPVSPRLLNPKAPRDLETICLKCLQKEPHKRYATAGELSEELRRFLEGEPIKARPVGRIERAWRWCRRKPAAAGMLASVLLLALAVFGGSLWYVNDRAVRQEQLTAQVTVILEEVDRLELEEQWLEALAAAERARAVAEGGSIEDETEKELETTLRELQMVRRLEDIRLMRAEVSIGRFDDERAAVEYERAFREFGVDFEALTVHEAVSRLKAHQDVLLPLVAAIDDFFYVRRLAYGPPKAADSRREVAAALDPDPIRNQIRALWGGAIPPEVLAETGALAESIDVSQQSPTWLALFARLLRDIGLDDMQQSVLRRAQRRYPDDFWINFDLANSVYDDENYEESIRFYSIAVALRPSASAALGNLGNAFDRAGNPEEAERWLRRAVELNSADAVEWNNLGAILNHQERFEESETCFRQAIALGLDIPNPHVGLSTALIGRKKFDAAAECARRAIELDSMFASAHNCLGLAQYERLELASHERWELVDAEQQALTEGERRQLEDAEACFSTAIDLDPTVAEYHFNQGNARSALGKNSEAVESFRRTIETDPTYGNAHVNLGWLLFAQGKPEESIACFRNALEQDPDHEPAHFNLGMLLYFQGDYAEAAECLRRSVELGATNPEARIHLGKALLALDRRDEAERWFRSATEFRPDYAPAHFNLGMILFFQNEFLEAAESLRESIRLDDSNAAARVGLSDAMTALGNLPEAEASSFRAIELDERNGPAHFQLGMMRYRQGRLDEAATFLERAMAYSPDKDNYRVNYGGILLELDRLDDAEACFRTVLENQPDNPYALANLGLVFCKQSNHDEANRILVELVNSHPDLVLNYAQLQWEEGMYALAISTLETLVDAGPNYENPINNPLSQNNLAWYLATCPDESLRDSGRAVALAMEARRLLPQAASFLNTLGVARYRAGHWREAVDALNESRRAVGDNAADSFFLAMSHWRLDEHEEARGWFDKAVEWMGANDPDNDELLQFRAEAVELLGVSDPDGATVPVAPPRGGE